MVTTKSSMCKENSETLEVLKRQIQGTAKPRIAKGQKLRKTLKNVH